MFSAPERLCARFVIAHRGALIHALCVQKRALSTVLAIFTGSCMGLGPS
jgi:hypothetical protein